jgi:hypothetical protein
MYESNRPSNLLTKFSHANNVLRFYDSYSSCQHLMNRLCKSTRQEFQDHLSAYRYGLRNSKRPVFIDVLPSPEVLTFVEESRLYTQFDLRLKLKTEKEMKIVETFLEEVREKQSLQFESIKICNTIYKNNPMAVNRLFVALRRNGVNGKCIFPNYIVDKANTKDKYIMWAAR